MACPCGRGVLWQALNQCLALQWLAAREADLVQVMPEQALPVLPVWLTTHRELRSNPRLRIVFDFLAQRLQMLA